MESARNLGLTASLIWVIMPAISVILVMALIFISFARYPVSPGQTLFASVFTTAIVVLLSVIGLVGLILFLVSMNRLARYYNEPGIFKNVLYGFLITMVGGVVSLIIEFAYLTPLIVRIPQGSTATIAPIISQFILGFIVITGVALLFGVINAVLYWRAFNKLAEKSGIENFKTAGLLYLIGTVLYIVGVGIILVWIAWIYAANGFHALKPQTTAPVYPPTAAPSVTGKIYCSYCGTQNDADAIYCKNCSKPLHTHQTSV